MLQCFQALASCFCFHPFLQKIIVESESSLDEEQVKGLPLTVALADLLRGKASLHEH